MKRRPKIEDGHKIPYNIRMDRYCEKQEQKIKELKVKMAFKDNSILALEKRGDHLKYTCENFEKQIKELKYLLLENDNQLEFHGVSKTTVLRAKNKRALNQ